MGMFFDRFLYMHLSLSLKVPMSTLRLLMAKYKAILLASIFANLEVRSSFSECRFVRRSIMDKSSANWVFSVIAFHGADAYVVALEHANHYIEGNDELLLPMST